MKSPFPKCPFRTDIQPYLNKARAREIVSSLILDQTFPCYQTTEFNDEGEHIYNRDEQHCAGAMIMLERLGEDGRPNQMMRIAERLGMYDRTRLDMSSPVHNPMTFISCQPAR